jgi:hypothetical protein
MILGQGLPDAVVAVRRYGAGDWDGRRRGRVGAGLSANTDMEVM